MQLLDNNGYSASQVIARMASRSDRGWAFPVMTLDYSLQEIAYLPEGAVSGAHYSLDVDSATSGVYTASIRRSAIDVDLLPNTYFRPEVWVWMGNDVPAGANDGDRFAKFPQGIFRTTGAEEQIDANGRQMIALTAHDLSELLSGDQLTNDFTVNVGDKITDQIKALLALSAIPPSRWNVQSSAETMTVAKTFEAGTDLLTTIKGLCDELNFVNYFDAYGVFNVQPWADPATVGAVFGYTHDGQDTILTDCRKQRDFFGLPNHLTLISRAAEDGTTLRSIAQNKNAASPISQANLKGLTGAALVRHRVEKDIEAASQSVLDDKAKRRMLEISTIPETFEFNSRLKPYHEYGDVIAVTRSDAGYDGERFEIRKIDMPYQHDARQQMILRRSIALA